MTVVANKFEERREELIADVKETYVELMEFYDIQNVSYLPEFTHWNFIIQHAKPEDVAITIDSVFIQVEKNKEIASIVEYLGVDKEKLLALMSTRVLEANLNDYGRFDDLKNSIDPRIAKGYFEALEGKPLPRFQVNMKVDELLRKFILEDGFELESPYPEEKKVAEGQKDFGTKSEDGK
ncbi:hypothetical protein P3T73_04140 [Kiritimatiellota bacterium B12222]|nr:hypothetical protein P3T73_04140 [Kiritimatiellota bacterium B12222]